MPGIRGTDRGQNQARDLPALLRDCGGRSEPHRRGGGNGGGAVPAESAAALRDARRPGPPDVPGDDLPRRHGGTHDSLDATQVSYGVKEH